MSAEVHTGTGVLVSPRQQHLLGVVEAAADTAVAEHLLGLMDEIEQVLVTPLETIVRFKRRGERFRLTVKPTRTRVVGFEYTVSKGY